MKRNAGSRMQEAGRAAAGSRMEKPKVLMLASVASMIDQFNMPNIRLLQEMGYEVHAACNFKKGNTCSKKQVQKLRRKLREMGAVQHQWDCPRSPAGIRGVSGCVRAYRQLRSLMEREQFAWVHCHSPLGGALARTAAHRCGIRAVYTAHGFHFYRGAPIKNWLLYYPVEKLLAHWTDALVTVNREDYRFAKRHLKAAGIYHIPGVGIDTARFRDGHAAQETGKEDFLSRRQMQRIKWRTRYGIPETAVLLLSVGELSRRKNHQAVLKALAGLRNKEVCYFICGQGARRDALRRQAQRLGVSAQVWMPGFLENPQPVYQMADIFVFPSRQEGLPAALMEAMAAGLPCIVSDIRGNRELLRRFGKTCGYGKKRYDRQPGGILFSLDSPRQLCDALRFMLAHPLFCKKCGGYNQKRIAGYDIRAAGRQMEMIYSSMRREGRITV